MKFYSTLKYHKLLILPLLFLFSIVLIDSQTEVVLADKQDSINGFPPSPAPTKFGLLVSSSGFSEQPESQSTTIGKTVNLTTTFVRPLFSVSPGQRFEWYRKIDDGPWQKDSTGNKFNMSVDTSKFKNQFSNKEMTIKYQLVYSFLGVIYRDYYYSQVATILISPKEVNADSLTIETGTNYLYNLPDNNLGTDTTFAKAHKEPENSTRTVTWISSDTSKATVDQNGKITAVPKSRDNSDKISSFYIYGLIINDDTTFVKSSKLMNVGGGLYDQKARAGEKATFTIQGFDNSLRDSDNIKMKVRWYKKKSKNGKPEPTNTYDDSFAYTTNKLTKDNDGEYYFAVITMTHNGSSQSLTTDDALLNVNPALDPNVTLTNQVQNLSAKNDNDTLSNLNNVVFGDVIDYKFQLNNDGQRDLKNTTLSTYLSLDTEITGIEVDGKSLTDNQFTTTVNDDNRNQLLEINIGDLKITNKRNIVVHTLTHNISHKYTFAATPYFIGSDINNNQYQSIGSKFELNYINNELISHIKNIDFEPIYPFEKDILKYRSNSTNAPNEIMTFEDNRKNKTPLRVYLNEPNNLLNSKKEVLSAIFEFIGDHQTQPQPIQKRVLVAESIKDQPLQSIRWQKHKGLLLHINNANLTSGKYSTELSWSIVDSTS